MFKRVHEEVKNIQKKDAENPGYLNVLFLYPSMQIKYFYKIAKLFKKIHLTFFAYLILRIGRMVTGIEINLGAKLGKRVFIDHGMGVVIGSTAIIGDDVVLYHGVTLGATKSKSGRRHPKIGNNVIIGTGAKILGDVSVGDNTKIGANAVVTKDIPSRSVAVGIPAKVIKMN